MDSLTDNHRQSNRFDDAIESLNEALLAGHSEQLTCFLKTLSKFHDYSFGNVLLISIQRPDATHVAGYKKWKSLNRQVRKGEKGIAIMAPIVSRKGKTEQPNTDSPAKHDDTGEEKSKVQPIGFRTAFVFDISQTEGEDLPEFPTVAGNPRVALPRIRDAIDAHGIVLQEEYIPGGALGLSEGGTITIRPDLSEAEKFRTLAHEFAHELLHKGERRSGTTKTTRETEAEAVAFTVCHAVGLDIGTSSSDYIQLYNGSAETLASSLGAIRNCSNTILNAVLPSGDRQTAGTESSESA